MFRRRSRLSLPGAVKAFERLRPARQRVRGRPDVVRQAFRADRFRTKPARINSAVQPVQGGPASGRAGGIPRQGLSLGANAPGVRAHISWILFETLWPVPRIGLFSHSNTIRKTRLGFPWPASMAPRLLQNAPKRGRGQWMFQVRRRVMPRRTESQKLLKLRMIGVVSSHEGGSKAPA